MSCSVSHASTSRHNGNPFSTSRFAPGALPYRFPDGESFETLLRRWENAGRRGTIVGPHGSGKSTLLVGLIPTLETNGRRVLVIELHESARHLPFADPSFRKLGPADDLFIDGYEQLSLVNRLRLRQFIRRRDCGLLVTSHRPTGFPAIHQTTVAPELAKEFVAQLTSREWCARNEKQIDRAFDAHQGNLREVFFDLYDLYERHRSPSGDFGDTP